MLKYVFSKSLTQIDDDVTTTSHTEKRITAPLVLSVYQPTEFETGVLETWRSASDPTPLISGIKLHSPLRRQQIEGVSAAMSTLLTNPKYTPNRNVIELYSAADTAGMGHAVLSCFEQQLGSIRPPHDHNKITRKLIDKADLSELHIDIFPGMEKDSEGNTLKVWRTFLNLSERPRTTFVCVHDPELVNIAQHPSYSSGHVSAIAAQCNWAFNGIILEIPAAKPDEGVFYGYEVLSTNLVHGEYGEKDDLVAIVNSLRPVSPQSCPQ